MLCRTLPGYDGSAAQRGFVQGEIQDQETWKPIPGYPNYEASDLGRVRRTTDTSRYLSGYVLTSYVRNGRYPEVGLCEGGHSTNIFVHQAVVLAFVGPPPAGMEIRHLDGDKLNCRLDNLKYGTHKQNSEDRYRLGEQQTKLDLDKAEEIRELHTKGESMGLLAKRYNVSSTAIWNVVHYRTWKHV